MRNLKRVLSLALALVMVLGMMVITTSAAKFDDAEEITYTEAVDVISAIGVITGDNGNFYPTRTLTREEGAAFVCYLIMGKDNADKLVGSGMFTDVKADRWSAGEIEYCANLGYIKGYTDANGDLVFNPKGELTAVAFGRMLLGALGYDGDVEGYTGGNWATNIAADMIDIGLDVDGVSMDAVLTRDQAAQMVLQALECNMVKYASKGTSISVEGIDIVTGASTAEVVTNTVTDTTKTYNGEADLVTQFVEKYFSDLKLVAGANDKFGRPGDYAWEMKGEPVYNELKKPVATYVNNFNGKAIEDLEDKHYTVPNTVTIKYNGGTDATIDELSDLYLNKMTGVNGYNVELYDTNKDKTIDLAVVSEGYFAVVGKFTEAKGPAKAKVEIKVYEANNTAGVTMTVTDDDKKTTDLYDVLTAYKKDDGIMVFCKPGWEAVQTEASILKVEDVTTVSGKVTKVTTGAKVTSSSVVMDGTTYALNNECVGVKDTVVAGAEGTLYLDAQGNVIGWIGNVPAVTDKAILITDFYQTLEEGKLVNKIEGILSSGETTTMAVTATSVTKLTTVYEYADANRDGVYELTEAVGTSGGNGKTVKCVGTTIAATDKRLSGVYFDENVKFIFADNTTKNVTIKDGIQTISSATTVYATIATKAGTNYVTAVYVMAAPDGGMIETSDIIYIAKAGDSISVLVGKTPTTFYCYDAYVNGEKLADFYAVQSGITAGFYKSVKVEATGAYDLSTSFTGAGKTAVISGTASAYKAGILTVSGADIEVADATIVDLTPTKTGLEATSDVYVIYSNENNVASYVYVVG